MNAKQQTLIMLLLILSLVMPGCGSSQQSNPTPTPTPIPTPIPPTAAPVVIKPTPVPFTAPVTPGFWSGSGTLGTLGNAGVEFLTNNDGTAISRYQISLCGSMTGDKNDIPIEKGIFSIKIKNPCPSGGDVIFTGIFTSEKELAGTITAGADIGEWAARQSE